ncbi:MAG: hypothetical protein E6Q97_23165 [Desulfurellales bacterium]|nr:MAG: hypothetical protein E6Q97_23165 [Desulfurellales bacterium]
MNLINPRVYESIVKDASTPALGAKQLVLTIREGLATKKIQPSQISLKGVALALGLLDVYDLEGSFQRLCHNVGNMDPNLVSEAHLFAESNPGVMTNAFATITGELIGSMVIEGYNDASGFIGDQLVTTVRATRRNQKLAGVTALGGPLEVAEGHPYSETDFTEKFVTTKETKKGRIISLSEELMLFDQIGSVELAARDIGFWVRQERERTIVRGVIDADSGSGVYVYRPSGVGEVLYNTDASNKNYIGSGGVTGFNSAVVLQDWTDVDTVLQYRATKVTDDRIDGTALPIAGLSGPDCALLVPTKLRGTAWYIKNATSGEKNTNTAADVTQFRGSPVDGYIGPVLTSPFIDEVNSDDWYYGNFKKQFIWTEIWPLQTFVQGRDSESAFDRDTALRVKARYYAGISARDTVHCTKIDGA